MTTKHTFGQGRDALPSGANFFLTGSSRFTNNTMKRLLFHLFAVLALSSCKNLTPEQNNALLNAALTTGQRVVAKATK